MAVVGGIIGGGIFRTPATVAERVGTSSAIILVWVVGGVIALIGAFSFAELGQRRPRAGGGYVYLRETFGPLAAFLYGWTLVLVIATGAIAAVAVTFADYTIAFFDLPHRFSMPLAVAAIALLAGINYVGVRPAAIPQNIFTILKLVPLAILIAAGLAVAVPGPPVHLAAAAPPSFGAALVPVLFTYGGWQQTNFIAEEIVDPARRRGLWPSPVSVAGGGGAKNYFPPRGNRRTRAQFAPRIGARRRDRGRRVPAQQLRVSARARPRRPGGEHRARGRHDALGPRTARRVAPPGAARCPVPRHR